MSHVRTHCGRGHELDAENTMVDSEGARRCRECNRENNRRYYRLNIDKMRKRDRSREREPMRIRSIERKWGMTYAEYQALLSQGCAICGREEGLVLDHCHKTGRVREALCSQCNVALGMLQDEPDFLRRAAEYLERHRVV